MEEEKRPVGRPPLNKVEAPRELTNDEKIVKAYTESKSSLQDIARIYNAPLDHVLNLTGNGELATVQFGGDLIDQAEAGRGTPLSSGQEVDVPFTLN